MDDDDFYANAKSPSAKSPSLTMAELKKRASAQKQKAKELQTSAKLRGDMAKIKAQQMAAEGKVRAKAAKESAKAEAAVAKEKAKHAKEKGKHEAAVAKQKAALAREGHHEKLLEERERQREFERAKDQSRLRSQQAVGVSTVAELRAQLNFAWGKYDEVDPRREAKVKGKAKEQAGLHIVMAAGTYTLDDDLKLGWGVRLTGWSDESEAEEGHADWNKTILLLPPGREIKAVGRAQLEDVLVRDGDLEGRSTPLIYVSGGQVVGEKAQLTLSNCDIEGGVANVSGELVMAKCKVRNAPATAIHCYTREGGRSEFTSCEIDGPGGSGIIVDAPLPPAKSETLLTKCKIRDCAGNGIASWSDTVLKNCQVADSGGWGIVAYGQLEATGRCVVERSRGGRRTAPVDASADWVQAGESAIAQSTASATTSRIAVHSHSGVLDALRDARDSNR